MTGLFRFGRPTAVRLYSARSTPTPTDFPDSATLLADVSRTEMLVAADAMTAKVVVGGPPCSGFSSGGRRQPDDVRNDLLMAFTRAVAAIGPDYFVLKTCRGYSTPTPRRHETRSPPPRKGAGYRVLTPWPLNAAEFRGARERWRVFVVGQCLRGLIARGLSGVELVTSNAHQGLREAIGNVAAPRYTRRATMVITP